MKIWTTALVSAFLAFGSSPAEASHRHGPYDEVVDGMFRHYLHRPANNGDLCWWARKIDSGYCINRVEAGILGSDEYFCNRSHHCPRAFVRNMFLDVVGRQPCPVQFERWLCRLRDCHNNTHTVAFEFLCEMKGRHRPFNRVAPPPVRPLPYPQPRGFGQPGLGQPGIVRPLPPRGGNPHGAQRFGISVQFGR